MVIDAVARALEKDEMSTAATVIRNLKNTITPTS